MVESWYVKWIVNLNAFTISWERYTYQIWVSVMLNCGEDAKLSTKETQSWEKEKFWLVGWESGERWNHGRHHRLQDVRTGHYRIHRSLLKGKKIGHYRLHRSLLKEKKNRALQDTQEFTKEKKKEQFSQCGSKKWTALKSRKIQKYTMCLGSQEHANVAEAR